ncbi:hypothetical protein HOD38_01315 [archaeon]|jgi:hypothetical protein|nr:hypothetical protein [archaeon]MBT4396884.1 hypothetical protein [archaeon]MBT4441438.1 hypothetical protein [archaeon]
MAKTQMTYIILGLVIILGIAGVGIYAYSPTSDYYSYSNGNTVFDVTILSESETKIPVYFEGDEQEYILTMRTDPASVEDIPLSGNLAQRIANDEAVYITIDPYQDLKGKTVVAVYELMNILDNELIYNLPTYTTVSEEYENKTVVQCGHANDANTVIFVTLGETTQVYADGFCIIVEGTDEDELIRAADRLAYHLLGIME